jgi:hypothetical protein
VRLLIWVAAIDLVLGCATLPFARAMSRHDRHIAQMADRLRRAGLPNATTIVGASRTVEDDGAGRSGNGKNCDMYVSLLLQTELPVSAVEAFYNAELPYELVSTTIEGPDLIRRQPESRP